MSWMVLPVGSASQPANDPVNDPVGESIDQSVDSRDDKWANQRAILDIDEVANRSGPYLIRFAFSLHNIGGLAIDQIGGSNRARNWMRPHSKFYAILQPASGQPSHFVMRRLVCCFVFCGVD